MSAYLLLAPFDAEDDIRPHAELVASVRPTAAQVTEAAGVLGLLPPGSYLAGEIGLSTRPLP